MELIEILFVLYVIVTGWGMLMTYAEQRATGRTSLVWNTCGLLACTVWPAILLYVMTVARRHHTA